MLIKTLSFPRADLSPSSSCPSHVSGIVNSMIRRRNKGASPCPVGILAEGRRSLRWLRRSCSYSDPSLLLPLYFSLKYSVSSSYYYFSSSSSFLHLLLFFLFLALFLSSSLSSSSFSTTTTIIIITTTTLPLLLYYYHYYTATTTTTIPISPMVNHTLAPLRPAPRLRLYFFSSIYPHPLFAPAPLVSSQSTFMKETKETGT